VVPVVVKRSVDATTADTLAYIGGLCNITYMTVAICCVMLLLYCSMATSVFREVSCAQLLIQLNDCFLNNSIMQLLYLHRSTNYSHGHSRIVEACDASQVDGASPVLYKHSPGPNCASARRST
jgi:hypothetical protein